MTRPRAWIRSAVRCGRAVWPPRAAQRDLDRVGGRRERAGAHADQAGRQLRRAVQREDRRDVLEAAGLDHLGRAGRDALLARLEEQPHPAGQLVALGELGQRQADTQQDRGVHVVAAGVGDVVHSRAVGHVLRVRQRQRVEVGPQRDDPVALTDVTDHTVALGQEARRQSGHRQLAGDQRGGLELLVGELRVGVDVTTYGYELRPARGQPAVELTGQRVGPRWCLGPG